MSGNQTPAYVRTGTPIAAGSLIIYAARTLGLDLTVDQAAILTPVVMFLYYVLGRALETYNPKLGYVLGIAKAPAYSNEPAPSPGPGEEVVAEVVPEETPQPVEEPVEEGVAEGVDPNVALLASHAGASPIDPPRRRRTPRNR